MPLLSVLLLHIKGLCFAHSLCCLFLCASAMLKHVIDIGWTSVCSSVCPSVTRWHPIKTAKHIVMLSSPHDSPFILVFCVERSSRNSLNRGGVWKYHNFRPITLYISETVEARWVHVARHLTSIEFSFDSCKFTAIVPGAYPGESKMWQKTLIRSRKLSKTRRMATANKTCVSGKN